jgi:hypothetical protein
MQFGWVLKKSELPLDGKNQYVQINCGGPEYMEQVIVSSKDGLRTRFCPLQLNAKKTQKIINIFLMLKRRLMVQPPCKIKS